MNLLLQSDEYQYELVQELNLLEKERLMLIWNNEYPMQLSYQSLEAFENYLNKVNQKRFILAKTYGNQIVGWFFKFEREGELWFATIVDEKHKGKGIGSTLLKLGKKQFGALNGWVIDHNRYFKNNGQKYLSPLEFYIKNACRVHHGQRLEVAVLSAVKITL
ncbi:GNAT family N-acetyltransferase [Flammeovirga aprica]|uniref:GNAT family N-acetyltransferase n=1 Tax=Flammeovirga aprica JL-4 TaxID=694437 RepID=A0A7X9P2N3_9BACT|nr:GNAT family N-acetyltransferase [Flammeovirga aprica]NME68438.1 GNAT family N-acetyltransferase [Flammeovirga aprica JL-4]